MMQAKIFFFSLYFPCFSIYICIYCEKMGSYICTFIPNIVNLIIFLKTEIKFMSFC